MSKNPGGKGGLICRRGKACYMETRLYLRRTTRAIVTHVVKAPRRRNKKREEAESFSDGESKRESNSLKI